MMNIICLNLIINKNNNHLVLLFFIITLNYVDLMLENRLPPKIYVNNDLLSAKVNNNEELYLSLQDKLSLHLE